MEEIWKDIKGYEGYYQISSTGHIKSLTRTITKSNGVTCVRKGKPKAEMPTSDGYLDVKLSKDGKDVRYKVHILVAKNFIEDRDYKDGWEVDHLDTNRANNNVTNLEWVTRDENIARATRLGHMKRYGEKNSNYGNDTLKKKFAANPELRKLQARKGAQNGRCVPLIVKDIKKGTKKKFDYLRECAKYLIENNLISSKSLEYTANMITKCIKSGEPYDGYTFYTSSN